MQPDKIVTQFALALQSAGTSKEKWNAEPVQIRQIRPETEGFPHGLIEQAGTSPSSGNFKLGQSPEKVTLSSSTRSGAVTLWKTPPTTSTANTMRTSAFRPFAEEEDSAARRRGFIGNRSTRL